MKRSMRVALLAPVACVVWQVCPAAADDFSDFRIPAHRVFTWDASLTSNGMRDRQNLADRTHRSAFAGGNVESGVLWIDDSDRSFTTAHATGILTGSTLDREQHRILDLVDQRLTTDSDSERRQTVESWEIGMNHVHYPMRDWVGFGIGVRASTLYSQYWIADVADDRLEGAGTSRGIWRRVDETGHRDEGEVAVTGMLQFGRIRDATSVYEAMVMERRLLDAGVLRRPLRSVTRRSLAALFYLGEDVARVVDRPARRVWQRLEELLLEDGAIGEEGLDAGAVQRIAEEIFPGGAYRNVAADGLPRSPILRLRGVSLGVDVASQHRESRARSSGTFAQRVTEDSVVFEPPPIRYESRNRAVDDATLGGPRVEWHQPWGPMFQVDVSSRLLLDPEEWGNRTAVTAAEATAIVSDRWLARARVTHDRTLLRRGGENVFQGWHVGYGAGVDYYLQDRMTLACRVDEDQTVAVDRGRRLYGRAARFSIGVHVRLKGVYEAPGVLPPIRI